MVTRLCRFGWPLLLALVACGQAPERAPAAALDEAQSDSGLDLTGEPEPGACAGVDVATPALPVDVLVVLDGSSSMLEASGDGVSKWTATKSAFRTFLERAPRTMGFGLSLFPVPGQASSSCLESDYRDAALPIAELSEMASGALAKLDSVSPAGQTPTAPAFAAALDLASARAIAHPERSVVVVLATDGMPTACAPRDAAALAGLAKQAFESTAQVRTLVVVAQSLEAKDTSGFENIASAGGTRHALIIDPRVDFASQLNQALFAAASGQVACDLALPEPPRGQHLDYDAVNVVLSGSGRQTLPRVSGPGACGTHGGWYYDVDPSRAAPSRLNVCAASCERVASSSARSLHVELGCKTVVR